jgi:hypothetical protein
MSRLLHQPRSHRLLKARLLALHPLLLLEWPNRLLVPARLRLQALH